MTNVTKPGPLLRSGNPHAYKGLGVVGRPVFSAALQMRSTTRRKLGADAADILAIPQISESGDDVDWYAPFDGPVVPWSSATPEERAEATRLLQLARTDFAARSAQELAGNASGDRELFARMLPLSLQIPDDSHIYLVGGRPVLTFWGFQQPSAPAAHDAIRSLSANPTVTAPMPAPPAEIVAEPRRRPWWWWLLWLFLLLALLALLLFGLRGCGVPVPGLGLPHVGGDIALPSVDAPTLPILPGGVAPDGGLPRGGFSGGAGMVPGLPNADAAPPGADAPPSGDHPASPSPIPGQPNPPGAPAKQDAPPADVKAPPGLSIPPEALKSGSTDFLNGHWRSRTGLVDNQTGRPIEVEYDFKNGKGTSTLLRSDGVQCTAPTEAAITSGKLVIDQTAEAKCSDGQVFDRSKVECTPGKDGRANCKGINAEGGGYHVQIVK